MVEQVTATVTARSATADTIADPRDRFTVHSDEQAWLPDPLAGEDAHPAPVDYRLASLAICQVSVLRQCLVAGEVDPFRIESDARIDGFDTATDHPDPMPEHTAGRIEHITLPISLTVTPADRDRADACLATYDDGCIVGRSIGLDYTPLTVPETAERPVASAAPG